MDDLSHSTFYSRIVGFVLPVWCKPRKKLGQASHKWTWESPSLCLITCSPTLRNGPSSPSQVSFHCFPSFRWSGTFRRTGSRWTTTSSGKPGIPSTAEASSRRPCPGAKIAGGASTSTTRASSLTWVLSMKVWNCDLLSRIRLHFSPK